MENNLGVKNWLAETKEGEFITIEQVKDNKTDYYCPCCKEILHARALESKLVTPHFYHLQNDNLNSCNYENAYKKYWKEYIITIGENITLPYLKDITCIEKNINYKVNDSLVADIHFKTTDNKEILFLFSKSDINFNNLDYDIYYIDFINLELNRSNLSQCIKYLYNKDLNGVIQNLSNNIVKLYDDFKGKLNIGNNITNLDINKFKQLQEELLLNDYIEESKEMESIINSIQARKLITYNSPYYKTPININKQVVKEIEILVNRIKYISSYNITNKKNETIKALKYIDYDLYKGNKWSKPIYFDYIKKISELLKESINNIQYN